MSSHEALSTVKKQGQCDCCLMRGFVVSVGGKDGSTRQADVCLYCLRSAVDVLIVHVQNELYGNQ